MTTEEQRQAESVAYVHLIQWANNQGMRVYESPDNGKAIQGFMDGMFCSNKSMNITGIYEMKCRDFTFGEFWKFDNEIMIPKRKFDNCRVAAKMFGVPCSLVGFFIPEDRLFVKKLFDNTGTIVVDVRHGRKETTKTMHGGVDHLMQSFIKVEKEEFWDGT